MNFFFAQEVVVGGAQGSHTSSPWSLSNNNNFITFQSNYINIMNKKYIIYLTGFAKPWLKKFQVHFNNLTSKSNGKQ